MTYEEEHKIIIAVSDMLLNAYMKGNVGNITNDLLCKTIRSVVSPIEPIDNDKLEEFAIESYNESGYIGIDPMTQYTEGFKAGYHKTMEE